MERLAGAKVFLGEPVTLRCRFEPWIPGDDHTGKPIVNWYHTNTLLTPEIQQRMGMKAECMEGECILRIANASRRFAGLYKCEASSPFGICETSCKLLIDRGSLSVSLFILLRFISVCHTPKHEIILKQRENMLISTWICIISVSILLLVYAPAQHIDTKGSSPVD